MDAEIDRLGYDLYGLTKDEIAIVEGVGVARQVVRSDRPPKMFPGMFPPEFTAKPA